VSAYRVNLVEHLLVHHRLVKHGVGDLRCTCGHRYRLGESIRRHRAELIVAALEIEDTGVDPELIPAAALRSLEMAGLLRT
jgi:hypothetical protein